METHVHLCGLNLIAQFMRSLLWATHSKIWFTRGCDTKLLKHKLLLSACLSSVLFPLRYLTSDFLALWLFLFCSFRLLPPSLECNFSLTLWLISPTLTTPVPSILYRRSADLDSHTAHARQHTHSYAHTHTLTLLRHSPVVWPVTTRQLFLLSCHVSHDVRALLCVIGWRLSAFCAGGRHYVGECRSLCNRDSWSKWSSDLWPLTLQ